MRGDLKLHTTQQQPPPDARGACTLTCAEHVLRLVAFPSISTRAAKQQVILTNDYRFVYSRRVTRAVSRTISWRCNFLRTHARLSGCAVKSFHSHQCDPCSASHHGLTVYAAKFHAALVDCRDRPTNVRRNHGSGEARRGRASRHTTNSRATAMRLDRALILPRHDKSRSIP